MQNDYREQKPIVEAKDKYQPYLPPGYPKFLFSGTHPDNLESIIENGIVMGTLTTDISECLSPRFSADQRNIAVCEYDPRTIKAVQKTNGDADYNPYTYFWPIANQGKPINKIISFSSEGTDPYTRQTRTISVDNGSIDADKVAVIKISPEQVTFINTVYGLLSNPTYYFDTQDPEIQRLSFELTGLEQQDFGSFEEYQLAIFLRFGTEEALINHLASQFPGEINFVSNSAQFGSEEIAKQIVLETYQKQIVSQTIQLLNSNQNDLTEHQLLLPGSSTTGLNKLLAEKGITSPESPFQPQIIGIQKMFSRIVNRLNLNNVIEEDTELKTAIETFLGTLIDKMKTTETSYSVPALAKKIARGIEVTIQDVNEHYYLRKDVNAELDANLTGSNAMLSPLLSETEKSQLLDSLHSYFSTKYPSKQPTEHTKPTRKRELQSE